MPTNPLLGLCIASVLLSISLLFYIKKSRTIDLARALSDFVWVLFGGIGAIVAFSTTLLIVSIEDIRQESERLNTELLVADTALTTVQNEHCGSVLSQAFAFENQASESCEVALYLSIMRNEFWILWSLPETPTDFVSQRALAITTGTTETYEPHWLSLWSQSVLTETDASETRTDAWPEALSTTTLYWYCYEINETEVKGCYAGAQQVNLIRFMLLNGGGRNGLMVGETDVVFNNVQTSFFRYRSLAIEFNELRKSAHLIHLEVYAKWAQSISFLLLAFAFPMRLWRSAIDLMNVKKN